jgi:hypothetical protein
VKLRVVFVGLMGHCGVDDEGEVVEVLTEAVGLGLEPACNKLDRILPN